MATLSPDLVHSARTLAECAHRGGDVVNRVMQHYCNRSFKSPDLAMAMAESVVRNCLSQVLERGRPPAMTEDEAYEWASRIAAVDERITRGSDAALFHRVRVLPQVAPREVRSAYEHVLAAGLVGVDAVGWEILEESILAIGWGSTSCVGHLLTFLHLVFNRTDEHCDLVLSVPYERLSVTASVATRLRRVAVLSPGRVMGTSYEWLLTAGGETVSHLTLHVALLMGPEILEGAQELLRE